PFRARRVNRYTSEGQLEVATKTGLAGDASCEASGVLPGQKNPHAYNEDCLRNGTHVAHWYVHKINQPGDYRCGPQTSRCADSDESRSHMIGGPDDPSDEQPIDIDSGDGDIEKRHPPRGLSLNKKG